MLRPMLASYLKKGNKERMKKRCLNRMWNIIQPSKTKELLKEKSFGSLIITQPTISRSTLTKLAFFQTIKLVRKILAAAPEAAATAGAVQSWSPSRGREEGGGEGGGGAMPRDCQYLNSTSCVSTS